ncbi:hypothetical protein [Psychromonas sp. Urea-02u-13]|uniref:hypothetical protein n=1 Tax=Psychromonas sp. Urea-02u-13 TaxID=2058326 RepID=UPI000C34F0D4|nr:hypothetical protein [Psychromonas sp. Urea-02u-13]PKG39705.1 hypothetical protein CXF74_07065 [Psychromonas sp. Urea-02u-13]
MFDFLEDLGETILDVGKLAAVDKYIDEPKAKKEPLAVARPPLAVATPSAYQQYQKPVAVNNNGAPVQTVTTTPLLNNNMLMIAGGVVALLLVLVVIRR